MDVRMPNGTIIKNVPNNITKQELETKLKANNFNFNLQPQPQEGTAGIGEALIGGTKRLISSGRTFADVFNTPEQAALSGIERGKNITERPGASLEAVKSAYNTDGVLSAAGEVASQVPGAVAEQVPFLASMAGGGIGVNFLTNMYRNARGMAKITKNPYAILAGSLLAPMFQAAGSAMERRAEEQTSRGERVNINRLKAAGIGVGSAALERASLGLSGLSRVMRINIMKPAVRNAEALAKQNIARVLATGGGKLIAAEVPTEVGQQMLERYYADLPLLNDEAKKEYVEAAYGAALLAPLGGVAGVSNRSQARNQLQQEQQVLKDAEDRRKIIQQEEKIKQDTERSALEAQANEEAQATNQAAEDIQFRQEAVNEIVNPTLPPLLAPPKVDLIGTPSGVIYKSEQEKEEYLQSLPEEEQAVERARLLNLVAPTKAIYDQPINKDVFKSLGIGNSAIIRKNKKLNGLDPNILEDNEVIRTILTGYKDTLKSGSSIIPKVETYLRLIPSKQDLIKVQEGYQKNLFNTGLQEAQEDEAKIASTDSGAQNIRGSDEVSLTTPPGQAALDFGESDRGEVGVDSDTVSPVGGGENVSDVTLDEAAATPRIQESRTAPPKTYTFEGKPIPQKLIDQHKKVEESDAATIGAMSTRSGTIISRNFIKQQQAFLGQGDSSLTTRGREFGKLLDRINRPGQSAQVNSIDRSVFKQDPRDAANFEDVQESRTDTEGEFKAAQEAATRLLGLPPDNTAMDRARAMGYNVDKVYYHGTNQTFNAFNPALRGSNFGPDSAGAREFTWFTDNPDIASGYADYGSRDAFGDVQPSGNQVYPVFIKDGKGLELDVGGQFYEDVSQDIKQLLKNTKDYDTVTLLNLKDDVNYINDKPFSPPSTHIGVRNSANIRSINAAFNPENETSSDIMFSREALEGTGQTTETVTTELVEEFGNNINKMIEKGKLVIVDNVSQLPANIEMSSTANGAYDPTTQTSYIVANRIQKGQGRRVLLHEIGEHYGLEKMVGKDYMSLLNRLKTLRKQNAEVQTIFDEVQRQYPELEVDSKPFLQEVMAKLGEKSPKNTLFRRMVGAVKNFLRRLGLYNVNNFNDSDIQDMILNSLRVSLAETTGTVTREQASGIPALQFSKADEYSPSTSALAPNLPPVPEVMLDRLTNIIKSVKDAPKDSLMGLFTKLRTQIAYSGAGVQEELMDKYNNAITNSLTGKVRADIAQGQSLSSNVLAAQAAQSGFMKINEFGIPKVMDSDNNLTAAFNLRDELGKKIGATQAYEVVHKYLEAARLQEEIELNAQRQERRNSIQESISKIQKAIKVGLIPTSIIVDGKTKKVKRIVVDNEKFTFMEAENQVAKLNKIKGRIKDINPATPDQLAAMPEALLFINKFPEIKKISEILREHNINQVNFLESTGIYSKEKADEYRKRKSYVPLYRVMEDLESENTGAKQYFSGFVDLGKEYDFEGDSDKTVTDILDNVLTQHFWATNAGSRNNAHILVSQELAIRDASDTDIEYYDSTPTSKNGETYVPIYKDGERKYIGYTDPTFATSVTAIAPPTNAIIKMLGKVAKVLRISITANPIFQGYQVFNDAIGSALISGNERPFELMGRILKGAADDSFTSAKDPINKQMEQLGIAGGYGHTAEDISQRARIKLGISDAGKFEKGLDWFDRFAAKSDLAQRRGIFEQTLMETGGTKQPDGSIVGGNEILAMNRALDIINWQKRGASPTLRLITSTIPFANAYIQGQDVLLSALRGKGISGQQRKQAIALLIQTSLKMYILNTIYAMLVAGDDEYEELSDREKLRSYVIPGTGLKVPVRAELSLLLKMIPELGTQYYTKKDTEDEIDTTKVWSAVGDSLSDALLGPTLFPQAGKGILEATTNHSFFTGQPLVDPYTSKLKTSEQFNAGTSELAKLIGQTGIISPIKMDHIMRSFFGTAGALGLYMIDGTANMFYDEKLPTTPLNKVPGLSSILYSKTGRNSINDYYALKDLSDEVFSTFNRMVKSGNVKDAKEYLGEGNNKKLLAIRKYIKKAGKNLKTLRDYRKQVINSSLDSSEKRKILDKLDKQTTNVVRQISQVRLKAGL